MNPKICVVFTGFYSLDLVKYNRVSTWWVTTSLIPADMYIASVFIRSSLLKIHSDMRDMPAPGSAMISSNRSVACVFRRNIPSLESPTITRFILIALVDYPVSFSDYIRSLAVFNKPITYSCQDFTSCIQSHERMVVHSICVHRTTTQYGSGVASIREVG